MELLLECARHMDHVTFGRFSQTCIAIYQILKERSLQAAREYALLPTGRAARCPEAREIDWYNYNQPIPSNCHIEEAIIENRLGSLRAFLDAGICPNTIGPGGRRLLGTAIWNGRSEAMNLLIDHKVDLSLDLRVWDRPFEQYWNARCSHVSPIHYAGRFTYYDSPHCMPQRDMRQRDMRLRCFPDCDIDMVSPLIRAGCQVVSVHTLDPLLFRDDLPTITLTWLEHGFTIDEGVGATMTLDNFAKLLNNFPFESTKKVFEYLIDKYPKIMTRRCCNILPVVHWAIMRQWWAVLVLLLEKGAEVEHTTLGLLRAYVASPAEDTDHVNESYRHVVEPLYEMRLQLLEYEDTMFDG